MDNLFLDPFVKLLQDTCSPHQIRALEASRVVNPMWAAFQESGFLDALVAEDNGGAGLEFGDVVPLLFAAGAQACPVPVAETMVSRALLSRAGIEAPQGPTVLANLSAGHCAIIPAGAIASHVLADMGDRLALFEIAHLETRDSGIHGSLAVSVVASGKGAPLAAIDRPAIRLGPIAAVLRAIQIAGVGRRVLEMTVAYAGDRVQFGKPIGKQQAIQQTLAVMAEHAVMCSMAAQIGCADGLKTTLERAAVAKIVASAAAVEIANTAHAVHGAIGISEEYDLQLLTRRLHEWRMADGSDSGWARQLGERHLGDTLGSSIDYVRMIEAH